MLLMCFRVQSHTLLALLRILIKLWNGTLHITLSNSPRLQVRWSDWLRFGWCMTTCSSWMWQSIPASSAAMCPKSGLKLNHAKRWVYMVICLFLTPKELKLDVWWISATGSYNSLSAFFFRSLAAFLPLWRCSGFSQLRVHTIVLPALLFQPSETVILMTWSSVASSTIELWG